MTTGKYLSDHSKHIYELIDKPKKQPKRIFINNEAAIAAHEFRTKLGFSWYDFILTKNNQWWQKLKVNLKEKSWKHYKGC